MADTDTSKTLPLAALHAELGAKFVPFAGWSMPIQYTSGVMAEHLWCRGKAGLFDVSHMGQVALPVSAAEALEALVPVDVLGLQPGRQRYGLLTNDCGRGAGRSDDRTPRGRRCSWSINAACVAEADIAHLGGPYRAAWTPVTGRALLALQGPDGGAGAGRHELPDSAADMRFMDVARDGLAGARSCGCLGPAIPARTGSRSRCPQTAG